MSDAEFNIKELAEAIVAALPTDAVCSSLTARRIMSVLQKQFDNGVVPQNLNRYVSKKKKEAWKSHIEKIEFEVNFWKRIVVEVFPESMSELYARLDSALIESGLKKGIMKERLITCFYCERIMDAANFGGEIGIYATRDHVIPRSKGGPTTHVNLVNACNACNFLKANLSIPGFIVLLNKLINQSKAPKDIPLELLPIIAKNAYRLL